MSIKPIEVFQFLKPEYNWIAKRSSENFFVAFRKEPFIREGNYVEKCDVWNGLYLSGESLYPLDIDYTGDWQDSLVSREEYDHEKETLRYQQSLTKFAGRLKE